MKSKRNIAILLISFLRVNDPENKGKISEEHLKPVGAVIDVLLWILGISNGFNDIAQVAIDKHSHISDAQIEDLIITMKSASELPKPSAKTSDADSFSM